MRNNFSQKDIVLVEVQYSNNQGIKFRPVVILSNNNYNNSCEDYLVANISSSANDSKYNLNIFSEDVVDG